MPNKTPLQMAASFTGWTVGTAFGLAALGPIGALPGVIKLTCVTGQLVEKTVDAVRRMPSRNERRAAALRLELQTLHEEQTIKQLRQQVQIRRTPPPIPPPPTRMELYQQLMTAKAEELSIIDRFDIPDDEKALIRQRIEAKYLTQLERLLA